MEINKKVSNPVLAGAIQLLRAEDTKEHRELYIKELAAATLISPAKLSRTPAKASDGTYIMEQDMQVQFPMIGGQDGKKFFVAFTDEYAIEQAKQKTGGSLPPEFGEYTVTIRAIDFVRMLFTKDPAGNESPCSGVVINPFTDNMIMPKELGPAIVNATKGK